MSIFWGINGFIGTIASVAGLLISWLAYKKIKQVRQILRKKTTDKIVVSNIETIMRYQPENAPISEERKRYIINTIKNIENSLDYAENHFELEQLNAIKSEINSPNASLENIKQFLKNIKQFFKLQSEV